MIRRRSGFAGLVLACLAAMALRAGEEGRPFSRTFGPSELGADPQNWSVAQDAAGRIYAGNNLGVLEHDGARWRLIPTRLGTTPRALAADAAGTIYVGGRGEFGWLAPDARGQRRFVPLDDRLGSEDRAFSEIWSVCATPEGVCFSARERLFRWDGHRMDVWRPKGTFFSGYRVGERYFVLDTGLGLLELKGVSLALIAGGEAFRDERPRFMAPGPSGAILWGSRTQGLVRFAEGRNTVLRGEASDYLVKQLLYAGLALRDGTLAMGTIHGGVLITDTSGRVRRIVDGRAGLTDPTVYTLHEDRRRGLWLGQSRGITYLEWPARFSVFGTPEGLDGVVVALHRHEGRLYASTQRGLFRLEAEERRFKAVQGLQGQCWNLLSVGERLFVANFDGIYEVWGDRAVKVPTSLGHTLVLLSCPWAPGRLLAGTTRGVFLVDPSNPRREPEGPLGDVRDVVQTLVPAPDGSVWVGCDAPIAYRIAADGRTVTRFGSEQGLPPDPWIFTLALEGGSVLLTPSGIFRREASGRFERDPRMAALDGEGAPFARVAQASDGGLWVAFQRPGNVLRHARRQPDGIYAWDGAPAFSFEGSLVYALRSEGGVTWFGGMEGLLRLEGNLGEASLPAPDLHMVSAQGTWAGEDHGGEPRLPFGDRGLRFEFALPRREQAFAPRFQVHLEGQDGAWSPWSAEVYRDYPGLREGRYRFQVRAQAGMGGPVSEGSLAFRVLPPWYRSVWAYVSYVLGALGLFGILHRLRMRVLEQRAAHLARRVEEATQELVTANRALEDLSEQKTRFVALVTHDLRSPLHGIAQAAERLQRLGGSDEAVSVARSIEEESLEMGDRVRRFLDAASWEARGASPDLEAVPLAAALHGAVERHRSQATRKGISLHLDLPPIEATVWTDARWLASILDNLLSNALKFSPPGKAVEVGAAVETRGAVLWVRDEGPGLTVEDRLRLFTRHAQLSARPTGGEASLGLGLALTRDLVTALGGTIAAEDAPGGGTTFRVELPSPAGTPPRSPS